jgi:hypothetical protein
LMSWLATDYQLGRSPDNLTVLEFTESGLPHYHLVLFGVSESEIAELSIGDKWDDYGQGERVEVQQAETIHDGDRWILHDDEQGKVSLSYYLGKEIRDLVALSGLSNDELRDRIESGDVDLWRQVLYWVSEKQYCSCSGPLKTTDGGDDLPHISYWRFVGSAEYQNIPAYVRENAIVAVKPPPD